MNGKELYRLEHIGGKPVGPCSPKTIGGHMEVYRDEDGILPRDEAINRAMRWNRDWATSGNIYPVIHE
jgi:hypothetical protein